MSRWDEYPHTWPRGRSYSEIAWHRAPYQQGYYQSGALEGAPASPALLQLAGLAALFAAGAAVSFALSERSAAARRATPLLALAGAGTGALALLIGQGGA